MRPATIFSTMFAGFPAFSVCARRIAISPSITSSGTLAGSRNRGETATACIAKIFAAAATESESFAPVTFTSPAWRPIPGATAPCT